MGEGESVAASTSAAAAGICAAAGGVSVWGATAAPAYITVASLVSCACAELADVCNTASYFCSGGFSSSCGSSSSCSAFSASRVEKSSLRTSNPAPKASLKCCISPVFSASSSAADGVMLADSINSDFALALAGHIFSIFCTASARKETSCEETFPTSAKSSNKYSTATSASITGT